MKGALNHIRLQYGVPVKLGMCVRVDGARGVITGAGRDGCAHLAVRFVDLGRTQCVHPTWEITYYLDDGSEVTYK